MAGLGYILGRAPGEIPVVCAGAHWGALGQLPVQLLPDRAEFGQATDDGNGPQVTTTDGNLREGTT